MGQNRMRKAVEQVYINFNSFLDKICILTHSALSLIPVKYFQILLCYT